MSRGIIMALLLGVTAMAGPALAQETGRTQRQAQQAAEQQMQSRMQDMERLMERMHATNQWMAQQRTHEHFRQLGEQMEGTGDRIRRMLQQCDQARATLDARRDRDRLAEMDRLRDRLHDMQQELDRAHDALRKTIGQP